MPSRRSMALLMLLATLEGGCRDSSPAEREASRAPGKRLVVELRDGKGRQVRLEGEPSRIVALSPSLVEILFAVGCGDRVVLRSKQADFPPEARRLPATNGLHLAVEHIVGFRPKLVLLSHLDARGVRALEALKVPVAVFEPRSIQEVFRDMASVGKLCHASPTLLRRSIAAQRRRVEALRRRVAGRPKPKVYVELDGSDALKPWALGSGSFMADLLRVAGGTNVFAALPRSYVQVNAEAIIAKAPEVIVLAGGAVKKGAGESLRRRPGWGGVPAVRRGRLIDDIDPSLLSRPGPRMVQGLEALASRLHPGLRR